MSRKPESQFIISVHKHIPKKVYAMKNHNAYVAGIADVWYSGKARALWIEYKFLPVDAPRTTVVPNLSPQQLRWIKDRKEENRNVWVIIGYKKGGVILRETKEMIFGVEPEDFKARTQSRKEIALQIHEFCTKRISKYDHTN